MIEERINARENSNNLAKKMIPATEQKKLLLDLLVELDKYCKENDCKYFLMYGTLLGAVRHSGFIPWDDDVDVCMLRDDYDRFIDNYKPSKEKYVLKALETDKEYVYPFAKLINNETVLIETKNDKNGLGVYLDIFPLDNCPGENLKQACKSIDGMFLLRWMRNTKIIELSKERALPKNILLILGKISTIFLKRRSISEMMAKKASKHKKTKCKYVADLVNITYKYGEVFDKKILGDGIDVAFEGRTFKAPERYDLLLKSLYGDYMKLPPLEKRVSNHNSICWYK